MKSRHWGWLLALASPWWLSTPAPAAVYSIGPDVSGTFYDPAQNGHGFVLQQIVSNGQPLLLATWFTYLDGQQRWLIGVGSTAANIARIPLSITSGGDFPPRFNPASTQVQPWGELVLDFTDKDHANASWTTSFAGFNNGSMPLQRLTLPVGAFEPTTGRIAACHAGSWYDPAQNGHGIFTEVLGSGSNRQLLAIWYAYLNGEQRWMTALGPINGDTATLTATITAGADFPPNFNPAQVQSQTWGTMTFTAIDANRASWTWNSTVPGFGSGSMNLTRLSTLTGSDCGPQTDKDAARFLTQASFGPTTTDVASVRSLGYQGWIDAQLGLPATLQRPTVEAQVAADVLVNPRNAQVYRIFRLERWFNSALYAPDQLRQRVAFALSQILVLSEVGTLENNPIGVAEYNDILLRHAFGNYRDLLRDVTLSPMMGAFLTHLRNQKTDWTTDSGTGQLVPGLVQPDENYAREVMQLFSIGLIERNRDFSPILVDGQKVATYTQSLVTDTAKVLTGLSYRCSGPATIGGVTINRNCGTATGTAQNFSTTLFFSTPGRYAIPGTVTALIHPDGYSPMICYPRYADTGRSATANNGYAVLPAPNDRKSLLAGITINASPVACHTATPAIDQQACIDYCNGQIATLLDSLFMHPNTPPMIARQLIQRLTTSNPSAGYIDRVAAKFEDNGAGVRGDLGAVVRTILLDPEARAPLPAASFGKLREPLLRFTAVFRALGASNGTGGANGLSNIERGWPQAPLRAPSVFNFYEPDYQEPGEIADGGLYSPEFQILNESTFITMSDEFWRRIFNGYNTSSATSTPFTTPSNSIYLSPTLIDSLPSAHAAMVDELNQRLLYGTMSTAMRGKLIALLDGPMAAADHRRKVLSLTHLIAISNEFSVQQ
ncbi:MAG: DUF1800 family protein [Xanthomonadales bacterium PRO6]|nr:hypothetical protein [Xanthomonadales bacterium]MCE7930009.1 DUF1800 family protein [Xanthomonadales bacterium PRO6]